MRSASVAILLCALSGVCRADSVKLGGFWINDVQIKDVIDGEIVYTTSIGTENTRPIGVVQGVKVDAFPGLAEAQTAKESGDHEQALAKYKKVAVRSRQRWARHYAMWHQLSLLDEHGTPLEAVAAYLSLVKDNAEPFYVATPPLGAMRRATGDQLKVIAERVGKVGRSERKRIPEQHEMMRDLLKLLGADQPKSKDAAGGKAPTMPKDPSPVELETTKPSDTSAVVLPSFMEAGDLFTAMLRGGRFRQAIEELTQRLRLREPKMAMRLYQLGVAQLNVALVDDDRDLMLSAGLSFMRVAVYFPKSRYKGPALIEAGLVHEKIDRPELAADLWRKARIEIDADEEPQLIRRIDKLQGIENNDNNDETDSGKPDEGA